MKNQFIGIVDNGQTTGRHGLETPPKPRAGDRGKSDARSTGLDSGRRGCIKIQVGPIRAPVLGVGYCTKERPAGRRHSPRKGERVCDMSHYVQCDTCGQPIDPSVPKAFCGFCSVTPGASCPWTAKAAVPTLFAFGLHVAGPVFGHEKGDFVPTDLPREGMEHIEQLSAGNSAVQSGFGAVQVMGTSTSAPTRAALSSDVSFSGDLAAILIPGRKA